jgi:hypothetical protein
LKFDVSSTTDHPHAQFRYLSTHAQGILENFSAKVKSKIYPQTTHAQGVQNVRLIKNSSDTITYNISVWRIQKSFICLVIISTTSIPFEKGTGFENTKICEQWIIDFE